MLSYKTSRSNQGMIFYNLKDITYHDEVGIVMLPPGSDECWLCITEILLYVQVHGFDTCDEHGWC